jgi:hypothetical protein
MGSDRKPTSGYVHFIALLMIVGVILASNYKQDSLFFACLGVMTTAYAFDDLRKRKWFIGVVMCIGAMISWFVTVTFFFS